MSFVRQLGALLRKDIVIRKFKRHYIVAALEYVLPLIIWGVSVYVWTRIMGDASSATSGEAKIYKSLGPYTKNVFSTGHGQIYFAPDNDYTRNMTANVFEGNRYNFHGFATEDEMKIAMNSDSTNSALLSLLFTSEPAKSTNLEYKMRWANYLDMHTDTVFVDTSRPRNVNGFTLEETQYLWPFMYAIFIEHLRFFTLDPDSVKMPSLQPLPTESYIVNPATNSLKFIMYFIDTFIFATFVIFLSTYAKNVMQDKETRLRELLRMMGLADAVYWVNALLVGIINVLPLCVLLTIALCVNFGAVAILPKTSWLLIFIVFLAYSIGLILIALLVSVLIKSAKLGTILVVLVQSLGIYLMQFLDPVMIQSNVTVSQPAFVQLITSMLPPCGIHWALKIIVAWERRVAFLAEIGANWSNLYQSAMDGDNVTLGAVLGMMIFSWLFWMLLVLYLDAIVPWQFGVPKHPLFFAHYSYWFPQKAAFDQIKLNEFPDDDSLDEDMIEPSSVSDVVISLRNITHNFGALRAVDNLSLELYANQITVLLGHNGAGKTTCMNILTGLFPPTHGDIRINGYDVRTNTKKAREGVGLCPQHNVLFDDLTVEEHLDFFSRLKSSNPPASEISDLLSKLDLNAKAKTLAKALSGGMKRKLSLANAMVGNSSILILDEPSSGLDPEARRLMWDLLQEERTRRTVLMTTHYMEEADVLGDRIAFVAKGKLMCAGSPMFLKRKFETGYKIRLTKTAQSVDPETVVASIKSLQPQNAANVHLVSAMSYEFSINIGFPGSVQMISLFKHLENNKEKLGIESMGASVTTMEDVFLKVGQREEDLAPIKNKQETSLNIFGSFPKFNRLSGGNLILRQVLALFAMRFHSLRRDWKLIAYMTIVPAIFSVIFALVVAPKNPILETKSITYNINSLLGKSHGFLAGTVDDTIADAFVAKLREDSVEINSLHGQTSKDAVDSYFLEEAKKDVTRFKYHTSAGALKGVNSIFFNGQPYHVGAAALAGWEAALLAQLTGQPSSVKISNHPLEATYFQSPVMTAVQTLRFAGGVFMGIVFAYVSCSLIITPIQERVRKSKLIQIMSGVRPAVYVGSNFAFDACAVLTSLLLCLIIMLLFNPMSGFTTFGETIPALVLTFVLFIFATTPWAYILSYLFTSSTTGFSVYLAINFLSALIATVVFGIIENLSFMIEEKADIYLRFLSFLPVFSAAWNFVTTVRNGSVKTLFDQLHINEICPRAKYFPLLQDFCGPCGEGSTAKFCYRQHSVFNMNMYYGIGYQLIALTVMGLIGFVVLILIEHNTRRMAHVADSINIKKLCCSKQPSDSVNVPEDSAVQEERQAVHEVVSRNQIDSYALVAKDISKFYGTFRAVNNISFLVKKNECFGLLGINGAGKTTTFSMLTGDFFMTSGNAYIQHTDVRSKLQAYQEYIGYCPQFDALVDTLTGREMLALFCGLRGVPQNQVNIMIDFMTSMADLKPHIDKVTSSYSGGNKRKLSLAIAMIGNPSVLFLDEPTAGVDPGARRKIWSTLAQAQKELNSSVVLTSHSMEECEALCHRLVIMFRGTFRCLGTSQQIKSRYGQGFTVMIKTKATQFDQLGMVQEAMHDIFGANCELKQSYQRLLQFHVNDTSLRWSEVFERIQKLHEKPNLELEDIQVSDTTLEQVFLNFAQENFTTGHASNVTTTYPFAV